MTVLKEAAEMGLNFVSLDFQTLQMVLLTGASFANSKESKTQLGFIIIIADVITNQTTFTSDPVDAAALPAALLPLNFTHSS